MKRTKVTKTVVPKKRGRPKKVKAEEPKDLKALAVEALQKGDIDTAQAYLDQLANETDAIIPTKKKFTKKPVKQVELPPSNLGLPTKRIFKENRFVDNLTVAKRDNYDRKTGRRLDYPDPVERREPTDYVKIVCEECHKDVWIAPWLVPTAIGDGREATKPLYTCDKCMAQSKPRLSRND